MAAAKEDANTAKSADFTLTVPDSPTARSRATVAAEDAKGVKKKMRPFVRMPKLTMQTRFPVRPMGPSKKALVDAKKA